MNTVNALKIRLTGYDAVYFALAEELEGLWLTFDIKAHNLIANEGLSVNLFEKSAKNKIYTRFRI